MLKKLKGTMCKVLKENMNIVSSNKVKNPEIIEKDQIEFLKLKNTVNK